MVNTGDDALLNARQGNDIAQRAARDVARLLDRRGLARLVALARSVAHGQDSGGSGDRPSGAGGPRAA